MTSETPGAITEAARAAAPATGKRYSPGAEPKIDRKSTRLNSRHSS